MCPLTGLVRALLLQDSPSADPLGDKWSDGELKTFYRLYRDHGTNWGKVRPAASPPLSTTLDSLLSNLLQVSQNACSRCCCVPGARIGGGLLTESASKLWIPALLLFRLLPSCGTTGLRRWSRLCTR